LPPELELELVLVSQAVMASIIAEARISFFIMVILMLKNLRIM
jgi:hypothetical protein